MSDVSWKLWMSTPVNRALEFPPMVVATPMDLIPGGAPEDDDPEEDGGPPRVASILYDSEDPGETGRGRCERMARIGYNGDTALTEIEREPLYTAYQFTLSLAERSEAYNTLRTPSEIEEDDARIEEALRRLAGME